jgi:hypothetical protein
MRVSYVVYFRSIPWNTKLNFLHLTFEHLSQEQPLASFTSSSCAHSKSHSKIAYGFSQRLH